MLDSTLTHKTIFMTAVNIELTTQPQELLGNDSHGVREIHFKPTLSPQDRYHVLIVKLDSEQTQNIADRLSSAQFEVSSINAITEISAHCQKNTCCVIIDIDDATSSQLAQLNAIDLITSKLPLIFISSDNDIQTRLKAVNSGGQAFIHKPIDYNQLLHSIDSLTERQQTQAYKVLIIDDQKSLSDYYAEILEQAGFSVCCVNDPAHELMPALNDYVPDLILLDLYMPSCSGQDLAGVIRQMDNYLSVPLVFLSAESSSEFTAQSHVDGSRCLPHQTRWGR